MGSFLPIKDILENFVEALIRFKDPLSIIVGTSGSQDVADYLINQFSHPEDKNLLIMPFIDQIEVLKNEANVFITPCGGSGFKSIYFHVPVICAPLANDQMHHSERITKLGAVISSKEVQICKMILLKL
jgi:spore coat polysaccharide biosynthesis predicted glycosyltransferase SpsG